MYNGNTPGLVTCDSNNGHCLTLGIKCYVIRHQLSHLPAHIKSLVRDMREISEVRRVRGTGDYSSEIQTLRGGEDHRAAAMCQHRKTITRLNKHPHTDVSLLCQLFWTDCQYGERDIQNILWEHSWGPGGGLASLSDSGRNFLNQKIMGGGAGE